MKYTIQLKSTDCSFDKEGLALYVKGELACLSYLSANNEKRVQKWPLVNVHSIKHEFGQYDGKEELKLKKHKIQLKETDSSFDLTCFAVYTKEGFACFAFVEDDKKMVLKIPTQNIHSIDSEY